MLTAAPDFLIIIMNVKGTFGRQIAWFLSALSPTLWDHLLILDVKQVLFINETQLPNEIHSLKSSGKYQPQIETRLSFYYTKSEVETESKDSNTY